MRTIAKLLAASALALSAGWASAQDAAPAPMAGMDHSAMTMGGEMPPGAMAAYMAAMDGMMSAMSGMTSTGDADADYLLMMIPHHRSAVEMSEALLPQVRDPEVRALAEAVIAAQEAEIASMEAMLVRLGHPVE
jgi:uncharacterized protein (DUF305 family)